MKIIDIVTENKKPSKYTTIEKDKAEKIVKSSKWYSVNGNNFPVRTIPCDYNTDGTLNPVIETRTTKKRKPLSMPLFLDKWINDHFKEMFNLESSPREVGFFALSEHSRKEAVKYGGCTYQACPVGDYKIFVYSGDHTIFDGKYKIYNPSDVYEAMEDIFNRSIQEKLFDRALPENEWLPFLQSFKEVSSEKELIEKLVDELYGYYFLRVDVSDTKKIIDTFKKEVKNYIGRYIVTQDFNSIKNRSDELIIVCDQLLLIPTE